MAIAVVYPARSMIAAKSAISNLFAFRSIFSPYSLRFLGIVVEINKYKPLRRYFFVTSWICLLFGGCDEELTSEIYKASFVP